MYIVECDDVVVFDYKNNVIECLVVNIFVIKNGKIVLFKLDGCGIIGVYLNVLCGKLVIEFKVI